MPLPRLIAYPPDGAAVVRSPAPGEPLRIGRAMDCGLRLDHPSVSRAHAELADAGDGWTLRDLGSKNGTFVDGARIDEARLDQACWLRFGDVHCEFALLDAAQARACDARAQTLRAQSQVLAERLAGRQRFSGMLDDLLDGVLQLSGGSRGFVLLPRGGELVVCAGRGLDALDGAGFGGSVGAVRKVLAEGRPLAVNRIDSAPWLAGRASVVAGGIQSLVCLPLMDGSRAVGAVYADRREPGEPVTQLDLDILAAFAESAAVWVLADHALEALDATAADAPRWSAVVSAHAGAPA
jgi:hypothetical protein